MLSGLCGSNSKPRFPSATSRGWSHTAEASTGLPAPVTRTPRPAASGLTPATVGSGATSYTGKGFDACTAPSSAAMTAWRKSSPYQAIGIYIGGATRSCGQPNLTASWVTSQAQAGTENPGLTTVDGTSNASSITAITLQAGDDAINYDFLNFYFVPVG